MSSKVITSYYVALGLISAAFIITTVFTASHSVDYGFQVKKMKIQQANLQHHMTQLEQEIANEQSLELAQSYANAENFEPVHQVITLTNMAQLASR